MKSQEELGGAWRSQEELRGARKPGSPGKPGKSGVPGSPYIAAHGSSPWVLLAPPGVVRTFKAALFKRIDRLQRAFPGKISYNI